MGGPAGFVVQITAVAAIAAATTLAACGGSDESTGDAPAVGTSPAHVAAPDAPNVVLVLTDDQDRASVEAMPQLRRDVADEGVTFTDAYATVPECCPSRASIFTGQYAHNHGVVSNEPPDGGVNAFDDSNALPVWLQEAGYRTAYVGKYLNGYGWEALGNDPTEIPDGWTDWIAPTNHTEYQMYDYTLNSNGELVDYGDAPSDYQTDVLADNAVRLLRQGADAEAPLFLTVAPVAPHDEGVLEDGDAPRNPRPAPRDLGRFQNRGLPRGGSFNEADVSDKPRYVAADPRLDADEIAGLTALYRSRLESLLAVDALVGRLVRTLRDEGELEETLFIYTSDNGYLLGEHRQVGKEKVYEESSGVPLIIRGPGFDPGTIERQPVGNVDLAPTILDLVGVDSGLTMDGVSLLERESLASRPGLVLELLSEHSYSGVRTDRYVFAERRRGDTELYDLERDPHELSNLAESRSHADLRQRLGALSERLRDCSGASCR